MIDKDLLIKLRTDINAALEAVGEKHGVRLSVGNCRFTAAEATFKLDAVAKTPGGQVVDKDAEAFKRLAGSFGLQPGRLGQELMLADIRHKIVGLQPKRHKYPIVCLNTFTGKKMLCSTDSVMRGLARRDANLPTPGC